MDGIYEEVPASLTFQDWADEIMLHRPGFDVVYAVQTGRDLIQQEDCGCLDVDDYTAEPMPRSAVALLAAAAVSVIIVAAACAGSLLILASGWTL